MIMNKNKISKKQINEESYIQSQLYKRHRIATVNKASIILYICNIYVNKTLN